MNTFCAATGLKVIARPEWTNNKVGDKCAMTFSVMGNAILYSAPAGNYDIKGITNAIQLKEEVKKYLSEGVGPYLQLLDYANIKGSSQAARKIFIKDLNDDSRLKALIFFNLSLPFLTAVKIGKQFITTNKEIHVVNNYVEAVKLALKLCRQNNLKENVSLPNHVFGTDTSSYSRTQVLLNYEENWDINVPGFYNRAVILDRCILHSVSSGFFKYEHQPLVEQLRANYQSSLPAGTSIKYMITDACGLEGMSHKARMGLMKSLKEWSQENSFRIYIVYSANNFMNTVAHMASLIMPFKIKIAQNLEHAFDIVRVDQVGRSSKRPVRQKGEELNKLEDENMKQILALIASLNWEQKGIEDHIKTPEKHPFNILFQSIKLLKEEFDNLLNEQKQLSGSLQEREKALSEINESLFEEISTRKETEKELEKHKELLEEKVADRTRELQSLVNVMAGRENRMAELKKAIEQLRKQLQNAGMNPVADDPLKSAPELTEKN